MTPPWTPTRSKERPSESNWLSSSCCCCRRRPRPRRARTPREPGEATDRPSCSYSLPRPSSAATRVSLSEQPGPAPEGGCHGAAAGGSDADLGRRLPEPAQLRSPPASSSSIAVAAPTMISLGWSRPSGSRNCCTNGMFTDSNSGTIFSVVTTCLEHLHGPGASRHSPVTGETDCLVLPFGVQVIDGVLDGRVVSVVVLGHSEMNASARSIVALQSFVCWWTYCLSRG